MIDRPWVSEKEVCVDLFFEQTLPYSSRLKSFNFITIQYCIYVNTYLIEQLNKQQEKKEILHCQRYRYLPKQG